MTNIGMKTLAVVAIAVIAAVGLAVLPATNTQTAYADHNSAYKATENASPNACKEQGKNPNCVTPEPEDCETCVGTGLTFTPGVNVAFA